MDPKQYHVCWPLLTAKCVEPVVSISWASCQKCCWLWQEGHPACKKLGIGSFVEAIWLKLCTSYGPSCHHHHHLCTVKSRMETFCTGLPGLSWKMAVKWVSLLLLYFAWIGNRKCYLCALSKLLTIPWLFYYMRNRHSDLMLTVVEHGLTVCECMFGLQLCSVIFIKWWVV